MELSRRQFFRIKPGQAMAMSVTETVPETEAGALIRPPGALTDVDAFRSACTRCGLCAEACEFEAITLLGPETGFDKQTPVMQLDSHPCRWCADMPCIAACAYGALVQAEPVAPIALAHLEISSCLVPQGTLCDECAAVCPSPIRAIRMTPAGPELNEELCVGCGLCAFHCAAEPVALTMIPRPADTDDLNHEKDSQHA